MKLHEQLVLQHEILKYLNEEWDARTNYSIDKTNRKTEGSLTFDDLKIKTKDYDISDIIKACYILKRKEFVVITGQKQDQSIKLIIHPKGTIEFESHQLLVDAEQSQLIYQNLKSSTTLANNQKYINLFNVLVACLTVYLLWTQYNSDSESRELSYRQLVVDSLRKDSATHISIKFERSILDTLYKNGSVEVKH